MAGKGSAAARAVRNDLVALVEQALVPDLFQSPPLGLDKGIMVGNVWIIHVCPETNDGGEFLPHALVFPDTLLTVLDERLHTIGFDPLLAVQSQHLLYFQLDRKSMGIPAGLTGYHVTLHGTVSRDHVLDDTGQDVTDMGLAVGCRRAVIKGILRAVFSQFDTFFKDHVVSPELFDLLFTFNDVLSGIYFRVHSFYPP